jgi:5-methyltetrahydrofolate--homocysteine methyltransferase
MAQAGRWFVLVERLSVEQRVQGFKRFFAMDNSEGPLVGFFRETYYPLKRYRTESFLPGGRLTPDSIDVEAFLPEYERLFRLHDETAGDFIWSAAAFWGIPWMEAMAGCTVVADHETGSSRSEKPECQPRLEQIPEFDTNDPWVQKALEFLGALDRRSRGRYPLATTLMRGISDLLAALYGNPDFLFALMDRPVEMRPVVDKLTELWIKFARAQLDRIPQFHGGTGSFYYAVWLSGKGVWLQEDASALMSPELFEQFIAPAIHRIAGNFDTSVIHLHPSTYIPVEHLVRTPLDAVELHIDFGGPRAEELYPYYRRILDHKPLIIWGDLTPEDLDFVARKLDRRALALLPVVDSRQQAEEIWSRFKHG